MIEIKHPGAGTIRLPGIDCQRATEQIVAGIKSYLVDTEGDGIVLGLSGGVDSSLTGMLCSRACQELGKKLYALIMPSDNNIGEDETHARTVAGLMGLTEIDDFTKNGFMVVPIQGMVDAAEKTLPVAYTQEPKSVPFENMQSRMRMILLYSVKEATGTRVAGTGNRDEDYGLGYFTKYGDGGVDFSPIANLPKRLVREMALYNCVPENIVYRTPTAGLRKGQTDADDLGCSYIQAEIIVAAKDQGLSNRLLQIAKHASKDIDLDQEIRKALIAIDKVMVEKVLHRHLKLAPHKLAAPPVINVDLLL